MRKVTCPGIPANWINGWLAATGATVLDTRIRLHWSTSGNLAVLSAEGFGPIEILAESWPSEEFLSNLPISSQWNNSGVLERKITVDDYQERVRAARSHPQSWTLSSTVTDLSVEKNGEVAHAPFDPPGPGTVKWLHYRLQNIHRHVQDPSPEQIRNSLMGLAPRVQHNGLGFDLGRIGSGADATSNWTDPVLEVMAFFGLALLPMRGTGFDGRNPDNSLDRGRQRGWRRSDQVSKACQFHWPAWRQPLDADGIDALLDAWNPFRKGNWGLVGVQAGWRSAAYRTNSASDPTRAYGAERI